MNARTTNSATTKLRLSVAFAAAGAMIASATSVIGAPPAELTAEAVGILETSWADASWGEPDPSFELGEGDGSGAGFGAPSDPIVAPPTGFGTAESNDPSGFGQGSSTYYPTDDYFPTDDYYPTGGWTPDPKPVENWAPFVPAPKVITLSALRNDLFPYTSSVNAGQGVDVALIDTGIAPVSGLNGPDKVLHGPDLSAEGTFQQTAYLDTYGHGTHMAGIIGGDRPGHEGVAPGSRIISLKVAGQDGATTVPQVVAAIDWVIDHRRSDGLNIRVLNLSLGQSGITTHVGDPLSAAVERAWQAGIVVVVATGNDGEEERTVDSPAIDPYVVAVGAVDSRVSPFMFTDRTVPEWSQGGFDRTPDLVAPGTSIASYRVPGSAIDEAAPGGRYGDGLFLGSGTSQAAAVTSGVAAVLIANNPSLTPDQVKATIETGSWELPLIGDDRQGDGHIDGSSAFGAPVTWQPAQSFPSASGPGTGIIAPTGSTWSGGTWSGSTWSGSTWSGSTWSGGTWSGSTWSGSTWSGSTWSGSTWSGGTWSGSTWSGGTWSGSTWSGGTWSGNGWD